MKFIQDAKAALSSRQRWTYAVTSHVKYAGILGLNALEVKNMIDRRTSFFT